MSTDKEPLDTFHCEICETAFVHPDTEEDCPFDDEGMCAHLASAHWLNIGVRLTHPGDTRAIVIRGGWVCAVCATKYFSPDEPRDLRDGVQVRGTLALPDSMAVSFKEKESFKEPLHLLVWHPGKVIPTCEEGEDFEERDAYLGAACDVDFADKVYEGATPEAFVSYTAGPRCEACRVELHSRVLWTARVEKEGTS